MAFAPLILTGNQTANGVDVSDQVMAFKVVAARERVQIPATFGLRRSFRAGDDTYEVQIDYLTDTDTTSLSEIFWDAIGDVDGTIELTGTMRPDPISATNPAFTMTAVVTGAGIGGTVNTVGVDSQTFPLTDRPTKDTTP